MHVRFEEAYTQLDNAFNSAERIGDTKTMGGAVGLMAQMCVDAILRNKLDEKGACSCTLTALVS